MVALEILNGELSRIKKSAQGAENLGIDVQDRLYEVPYQFPDGNLPRAVFLPAVGAVLPIRRKGIMAIVAIAGSAGGLVFHSGSKYGLKIDRIYRICKISSGRMVKVDRIYRIYRIRQAHFAVFSPIALTSA